MSIKLGFMTKFVTVVIKRVKASYSYELCSLTQIAFIGNAASNFTQIKSLFHKQPLSEIGDIFSSLKG